MPYGMAPGLGRSNGDRGFVHRFGDYVDDFRPRPNGNRPMARATRLLPVFCFHPVSRAPFQDLRRSTRRSFSFPLFPFPRRLFFWLFLPDYPIFLIIFPPAWLPPSPALRPGTRPRRLLSTVRLRWPQTPTVAVGVPTTSPVSVLVRNATRHPLCVTVSLTSNQMLAACCTSLFSNVPRVGLQHPQCSQDM